MNETGRQFFNVRLRVTNEKTGVSQVHDVLVRARDTEHAKVNAKEDVLSGESDIFHILDTNSLGTASDTNTGRSDGGATDAE